MHHLRMNYFYHTLNVNCYVFYPGATYSQTMHRSVHIHVRRREQECWFAHHTYVEIASFLDRMASFHLSKFSVVQVKISDFVCKSNCPNHVKALNKLYILTGIMTSLKKWKSIFINLDQYWGHWSIKLHISILHLFLPTVFLFRYLGVILLLPRFLHISLAPANVPNGKRFFFRRLLVIAFTRALDRMYCFSMKLSSSALLHAVECPIWQRFIHLK